MDLGLSKSSQMKSKDGRCTTTTQKYPANSWARHLRAFRGFQTPAPRNRPSTLPAGGLPGDFSSSVLQNRQAVPQRAHCQRTHARSGTRALSLPNSELLGKRSGTPACAAGLWHWGSSPAPQLPWVPRPRLALPPSAGPPPGPHPTLRRGPGPHHCLSVTRGLPAARP